MIHMKLLCVMQTVATTDTRPLRCVPQYRTVFSEEFFSTAHVNQISSAYMIIYLKDKKECLL